jgi:hypothetical protein
MISNNYKINKYTLKITNELNEQFPCNHKLNIYLNKYQQYGGAECSVCTVDFVDTIFNCGHGLCRDCYNNIKKRICPLCRAPITKAIDILNTEEYEKSKNDNENMFDFNDIEKKYHNKIINSGQRNYYNFLGIVRNNGIALENVPEELKNNLNIVKVAVTENGLALQFASEGIKNNLDIVRIAVTENGLALQFASEGIKNNLDIVRLAVSNNGLALQFASNDLKNNLNIVRLAVSNNGLALQFASNDLKNNLNIVKIAVSRNGLALQFASDEIKNNSNIVKIAVISNGLALQFASDELKGDNNIISNSWEDERHHINVIKNIIKLAINNNVKAFNYISNNLKNDESFIVDLVKIDAHVYTFLNDKFKNNYRVLVSAIKSEKNGGEHIYKIMGPYIDENFKKQLKEILYNID